jgi:putative heme degradation protein
MKEQEISSEEKRSAPFRVNWDRMLADLPALGKVRAVVRNESAVSEMLGTLEGCRLSKGWFTVENDHFHLHLKAENVAEGYFVEKGVGESLSVQLADRQGTIILKFFLLEKGADRPQRRRYEALKETYLAESS